MADSVVFLARFRILSFTETAIERYEQLKRLKLGTKKMDLRIAAITLVHSGILVTRNVRDFQDIPSLVIQDWSAEEDG